MSGILMAVLCAAAAAQESKPNQTIGIPGTDLKFEMVYVPGGKARSGEPPMDVLLRPYWMSKTEVTWECFVRYFENRKLVKVDGVTRPSPPYEPPHGTMGTGAHPAVGMRWHGAMGYCEWVSALTGQRFRLPTDAEWEFAARAGSTAAAPDTSGDAAWLKENAGAKTHLTGTTKPNALGICDLIGNVWEYSLEYAAPPEYRPMLRGGAWSTPAAELRFASRQDIKPEWYERDPNRPRSMWWLTDGPFIGFRLVRFADAPKKDQDAYAAKLEISGLAAGEATRGNARVTGRIKNGGDRALDEVELTVFYTEDDGKPVFEDGKARPCFSKAWPVLVNSDKAGDHRAPLGPGETRAFALEVPQPFETETELTKVGAKVSALQFSK
jgi:formylglycine-generating enzyme required for sulfatase activity